MVWVLGLCIVLIIFLTYLLFSDRIHLKELKEKLTLTSLVFVQTIHQLAFLKKQVDDLKNNFTQNVLFDSMTGLPNRLIFEDHLEQAITEGKRFNTTFAVLFINFDELNTIKDALGLGVGDNLLKEAAVRLKSCIRKLDTLSRFNSDEFVVLLSQLNKAETAVYVAKRFLDVLSQPFKVNSEELYVTATIGIAIFPNDGEDSNTLLKNAANALHQAKHRGRNTYQFYQEDMQVLSRRELILSSNLRSHSIFQEFNILYQPQINVETKQIFSMHALLQWQHPEFGIIPIEEFIRLAENSGKISNIGEWMMGQILHDCRTWVSQGFSHCSLTSGIFLKQLENPHFIYQISQMLQEMQFDPSQLIFEVSEVMLLSNLEALEKTLHMLKHTGVQIAVNEFGKGHLALQYLKRLPFDYLKLDNTLIQDIAINNDSAAIVKMIISLAKQLKLKVIAEGVETEQQVQLLRDFGCIIMQGNIFSPARPAKEFSKESVVSGLGSE